VRLGALPISVDFEGLDRLSRDRRVITAAADFRGSLGDPRVLILGVDRLDYTKGIPHRLRAYDELLRDGLIRPPEVTLVQVGLPSRQRIDAYHLLRTEVEDAVRRTNDDYSAVGSAAVHLLHQFYSRPDMVSMYLAADVMLVTPPRDGINLVAKEYVACRHDLDGALVLSEFTGAWNELRQETFTCNPHDIDGVKHAIMSAITAPGHERRRRMEALRGHVACHDVQRWAAAFLEALAGAPGPR
jgi:trehalose 6-phosphate synthase